MTNLDSQPPRQVIPARPADLLVFLAIAFGGAWLAAIPLWTAPASGAGGALQLTLAGMQLSPTLGVLAVWLLRRDRARAWARDTGLTLGGRRGRTLGVTALTWIGTPVLVAAVIAASALLGLFPTDLAGLSGYRQVFPGATHSFAIIGALLAVVVYPLLYAIGAFGEEWGWRGWLLPRLMPLGPGRALLVSGVIWGLWHAPLTAAGLHYPGLGWAGVPLFTVSCVALGSLLGLLRLRTASIWPAVIGHAAFNASAQALPFIVSDARHPADAVLGGVFGVTGWVLTGAVAVLLARKTPAQRPALDVASR
ncbi:CPBP family intramembrane glutamic endopeptidase [Nonomuraea sp. NPDC003804]|uniref:CPBP family intramembrane glutamic endopeptidase n=1 Tax=Nonomuraea sp. NPDC003804 TaxID=3154547 RepID=UPI0033B0D2D3